MAKERTTLLCEFLHAGHTTRTTELCAPSPAVTHPSHSGGYLLRTGGNRDGAVELLEGGVRDGDLPEAVGVDDGIGAVRQGGPIGGGKVGVGDHIIGGLRRAQKVQGESAVDVCGYSQQHIGLAAWRGGFGGGDRVIKTAIADIRAVVAFEM